MPCSSQRNRRRNRLVVMLVVFACQVSVSHGWLSTTSTTTTTIGFSHSRLLATLSQRGQRRQSQPQHCNVPPLWRSRRSSTARHAVEMNNHSHRGTGGGNRGLLGGGGSNSSPVESSSSSPTHMDDLLPLPITTATHELETKLMYKEHSPSSSSVELENDKDEEGGLTLQQKAINLLFLSAAFGYAIYTIANIDHGMTRGWSPTEIAMRIPLDNWGAYESYLANKPIVTKTLINVIIYLLGDWLSQTAFQGKNVLDFDISRTLRNGFIGLCFGPLVHQYYEFSDAILPPENGLVTRLEKILMDQTIYLTVKCSVYISAVGLLAGEEWPTVKQTVEEKIGGVVLTAWKFWPIIHCITYSLIPAQHRILWVNSVDLVWNGLLASMAQKKSSVFEELEGGEEEDSQLPLSAFEVVSTDGDDTPNSEVDESLVMAVVNTAATLSVVNDTSAVFMEDYSPEAAEEGIFTLEPAEDEIESMQAGLEASSSNVTARETVSA